MSSRPPRRGRRRRHRRTAAVEATRPERPYATLAPYFAQLFEPRGIRRWFVASSQLVAAAGLRAGRHLDVGAGTCRYSRYWARAGFRSVCVDVLHQMLVRARLGGTGGRLARVCGTLDCLRSEPAFDLATAIDDVVSYVGAQEGGLERSSASSRRDCAGRTLPLRLHHAGWPPPLHVPELPRVGGGRITADSRGRFDEAARILSVDLTLETPDHVAHERHVMRLYSVGGDRGRAPAPGLRRDRRHRPLRRRRRVVPGGPAVLRRSGPAAMRPGAR